MTRCWWPYFLLLIASASASAQFVDVAPGRRTPTTGAAVPIYIEDSPAAQEMVADAQHLHGQGRLAQAVVKYQQLIEQGDAWLMADDTGLYTSVSRWVQRELQADADLLDTYRRAHEPLASSALSHVDPADPIKALESLVGRYRLCRSGLEAGLRLASLYLERGSAFDAQAALDDLAGHGDLDEFAGRWHLLQAAAGIYAADAPRLNRHLDALRLMDDPAGPERVAQIESWIRQYQPLPQRMVTKEFRTSAALTRPRLLREPLWEAVTSVTESGDGGLSDRERNLIQLHGGSEDTLPHFMLPLVQGEELFVNDGASVAALDRASGRLIWAYRGDETTLASTSLRGGPGMSQMMSDQRGVALEGHALAAVLGRASTLNEVWRGKVFRTWLVCLSRDDGSVRWRVEPGTLDDTLSQGFFHGTPIIQQGRVYALIRRTQMSGFHGAFVVAVDVRDGRLLWRRHLASAVPTASGSAQSLTQMTFAGGRLYLVDNLGSISCLDARNGSVRWLKIVESAAGPQGMILNLRQPRILGSAVGNAPVLTSVGLIVSMNTGSTMVWLMDPDTGRRRRDLTDSDWSQLTYLLPAPGGVITVGDAVRCYDGDAETLKLRWSYRLDPVARRQLRGRPDVSLHHMAMPMADQLLVLDLRNGKMVSQTPLAQSGNVVALEDQVLLAGSSAVYSYMGWDDAATRLRRQVAQQAHDPRPGLSLAHLALATENWTALLEGVDGALAALRRRREAAANGETEGLQQEVFRQIRAMIDPDAAGQSLLSVRARRGAMRLIDRESLRGEMFDRLADAVGGPADVVAYRLALGRFLLDTARPLKAVAEYQAILSDPVLASQQVQFASGSRQAGLEARLRLKSMVQALGPDVYAAYEAIASARFAEMSAAGAAAEQWIELAEHYPLASTTPAARAMAAEILARQGQRPEAIVQLHRAYDQARQPALVQMIVGRLVELYEQQGRLASARQWLHRARREHPDLEPLRQGTPIAIDQWMAQLSGPARDEHVLPDIALPLGRPYVVTGRVLLPQIQRPETWPKDLALFVEGDAIRLHGGTGLEPLWTLPLPAVTGEPPAAAAGQLLSLTADQALFWFESSSLLMAVDVATGSIAWQCQDLSEQIGRIEGEALTIEQRRFRQSLNPGGMMINRGQLEPARAVIRPGYLLALSDLIVCVGDYGGRVLALDRHSGEVLWRHRMPMEQVTQMTMDESTLAVAGITGFANESPLNMVVMLDALNGDRRVPQPQEKEPIFWMGFADSGLFMYATSNALVGLHLGDGNVAWRTKMEGRPPSGRALIGDDFLVLQDITGAMQVIDTVSGKLRRTITGVQPGYSGAGGGPRFAAGMAGELPPGLGGGAVAGDVMIPGAGGAMRMQLAGRHWHLLTPWQAQARDEEGRLMWRDAISVAKKEVVTQLLGDKLVMLTVQMDTGEQFDDHRPAPMGDAAMLNWYYRLFLLDRQSGMILAESDLPLLAQPLQRGSGLMLDHAMVVSTNDTSIIIPGRRK